MGLTVVIKCETSQWNYHWNVNMYIVYKKRWIVPYSLRTLCCNRSTPGLHACCPGEGGIVNSCPRRHRSGGLPAICPDRWVCIWNSIEYLCFIHCYSLHLAIFCQHHRPRSLICISPGEWILGLFEDWDKLWGSQPLLGVYPRVFICQIWLISHQQSRLESSQNTDKVVIFHPLSKGES